ncbi:MAG: hypothetical protein ABEH40_04675 [Haloferacaceae archaeon]
MTLDIGDVLSRAARRTVARNGLILVGIVYVLGVLSGLFGPRRPDAAPGPGGLPAGTDLPTAAAPDPVIPVSPAVAAVVGLVFALLTATVSIGAFRVFLTDERERLPAEAFTRRLAWTLLNVVVGGVVFGIAVGVGLLLLVVPGVFLAVALAFWAVIVVDEGVSFVAGFRRSWRFTGGHRLRLFLLGLVVFVAVLVTNLVFGAVGGLVGFFLPALGVLVGQIGSAFTTVFVWATLAAAYRDLGGAADPAGGMAA